MRSTIIQFFINRIVAWVSGLTSAQFSAVKAAAENAEHELSNSADKAALVKRTIRANAPAIATWALNLVLELAVAIIKKP